MALGAFLDGRIGLPSFRVGIANYLVGGVLAVLGFFLAAWSILAQLTHGRGTPIPAMPTQELLTHGPFRYCRNPMSLGTLVAYLGVAVFGGTTAGVGLVVGLAVLLIVYLKEVEERELSERFGEAYQAYKREVPFMIPRGRRRRCEPKTQ